MTTDARTRLVAIMSVVAIVLTTIVSIAFTERANAAEPDARPNILLISSDDQTDMELRYMPLTSNLLTDAGINFTDGINQHPLCCPARAEILTGEYGHNNGVHHNTGPWGGYSAFLKNGNRNDQIGQWMHDAGYTTALIGKPLNGLKVDSPRMGGWDYYSPTVKNTYSYYGTTFLNDGEPRRYDSTYVADVVRDQTVDKINEWSAGDKPFFIWSSHVGPHGAINPQGSVGGIAARGLPTKEGRNFPVPALRHDGDFQGAFPNRTKPSYNERDLSDKPDEVQREAAIRTNTTELFRTRVDALQAIDESNAATVAALKANGEWDNTIIVYVSDNGWMFQEHALAGKNYVYEENLQIPFIMRDPTVGAGTRPQTATLVDLAPTFLDYAGALAKVRATGRTDGLSLRPSLNGEPMPNDTTLIQAGIEDAPWWWRGVRSSRYTWSTWASGQFEAYDRRADPFQLENLVNVNTGEALQPRYGDVIAEMRSRFRRLASCDGVRQCEMQDFGSMPSARRGR